MLKSPQPELGSLLADLRNAVTAVLGYLELVEEGDGAGSPEQRRRWLQAAAERLVEVEGLSGQMASICRGGPRATLREP